MDAIHYASRLAHARRRARARYALELTDADLEEFSARTATGAPGTLFLGRGRDDACGHYAVWHAPAKVWLAVVHDDDRGVVVTCLPPECITLPKQSLKEEQKRYRKHHKARSVTRRAEGASRTDSIPL